MERVEQQDGEASCRRIRVKVVTKSHSDDPSRETVVPWGRCDYVWNNFCTDYDWLIVYDEVAKGNSGTIVRGMEPLKCPAKHTVLVTVEPPNIKIYGTPYTDQFEYVLTTQPPELIRHRNFMYGEGCLLPFYGKNLAGLKGTPIPAKTKLISTVCSAKQQRHTRHFDRYRLTEYVASRIDGFDWYGKGVRPIGEKYEALDDYRYHLAIENHIQSHHWTEKLEDSLLAGCLTFYAGDPDIFRCFPEGSLIPVSLDDPAETLRIIQTAIAENEYEKRLPQIIEARELVLNRFNFYARTSELIESRDREGSVTLKKGRLIKGRHALRRNPVNVLRVLVESLKYKAGLYGKSE